MSSRALPRLAAVLALATAALATGARTAGAAPPWSAPAAAPGPPPSPPALAARGGVPGPAPGTPGLAFNEAGVGVLAVDNGGGTSADDVGPHTVAALADGNDGFPRPAFPLTATNFPLGAR